jgi:hypothetical protein
MTGAETELTIATNQPTLEQLRAAEAILLTGGTAQDLLDVRLGGVTAALAASPYEIVSTEQPRHYFADREFYEDLRNVEALRGIAARGTELLRGQPEYASAPEELKIGHDVVAAFGNVVSIEAEGVHVENEVVDAEGEVRDGIVTAETMTFYCADWDQAEHLRARIRPLLQTVDPAYSHDARLTRPDADGRVGVRIARPTEHTIRELGSTLAAMVAIEKGVSPQEIKLSLAARKARGETFSPEEEQALIEANGRYSQIKNNVSATYYLTNERRAAIDRQPTTNRDLLTRDIPALQAARDIMNGLVRSLPGRVANLEQHPDPKQRLASHGAAEMTRYDPHPEEPHYEGVSLARRYRMGERLKRRFEHFRSQRKRDMAFAVGAMILKFVAEGRGAALELAIDAVQEARPHAGSVIKRWRANVRELKEHRKAVVWSRQATLHAVRHLMRRTIEEPPAAAASGV